MTHRPKIISVWSFTERTGGQKERVSNILSFRCPTAVSQGHGGLVKRRRFKKWATLKQSPRKGWKVLWAGGNMGVSSAEIRQNSSRNREECGLDWAGEDGENYRVEEA